MFWKQFALKWTAAQEQSGFRTQLVNVSAQRSPYTTYAIVISCNKYVMRRLNFFYFSPFIKENEIILEAIVPAN